MSLENQSTLKPVKFQAKLLIKIITAIIIGIVLGLILSLFSGGVVIAKILMIFNSIFSNFLSFIIPLLIIGLVARALVILAEMLVNFCLLLLFWHMLSHFFQAFLLMVLHLYFILLCLTVLSTYITRCRCIKRYSSIFYNRYAANNVCHISINICFCFRFWFSSYKNRKNYGCC